jgi:thioredoxin-related protein
MMPASHKLQEKFKNEDVVFLYVSIDRNENAWKQSAEKFGLTGYNYIAKNYPKAKLFQTNNVSTIPRYMLFDKNGRLVDSNAQRPNSRLLEENIRAFLRV